MAIQFYTGPATGRAACQVCERRIKKGEKSVGAHGFRSEGHAHLSCLVYRKESSHG